MIRALPPDHPDFKHGASGYKHGLCRCLVCRQGNRVTCHSAYLERKLRLAQDPSIVPHGTRSTYANWGCRCIPCKEVHKKVCRDYYRTRKQKAK